MLTKVSMVTQSKQHKDNVPCIIIRIQSEFPEYFRIERFVNISHPAGYAKVLFTVLFLLSCTPRSAFRSFIISKDVGIFENGN